MKVSVGLLFAFAFNAFVAGYNLSQFVTSQSNPFLSGMIAINLGCAVYLGNLILRYSNHV